MNIPRIIISLFTSVAVTASMASVPAEALKAYQLGDYDEAAPALADAARQAPKDAQLNTKAGIALFYTGHEAEAASFLHRGDNEANLYLAQIAMHSYNFDKAEEYLDRYEDGFKKSRRAQRPERPEATAIRKRVDMGRKMLDRVENIIIIDSIDVDKDDFFRAYRLSAPSGSLRGIEELPRQFEAADPSAVFVTENADEIFWVTPDSNEDFRIAVSSLLADGSWEAPVLLPDLLNEGGDANYPFMMSDGVTLYYANTGENALGGYDIFISRRDGDSWYQPQNIGMPYNSYANDYLLAIDEITGAGWWATDRNAAPGRVTVYIFVPSELRVNYPVDFPDLTSRALVERWRDTHPEGSDYSDILASISAIGAQSGQQSETFRFAVPTKGIYTTLDDFRRPAARKLMHEYLRMQHEFELTRRKLQVLRDGYARGNRGASDEILSLESEIETMRGELRHMVNRIVSEENR